LKNLFYEKTVEYLFWKVTNESAKTKGKQGKVRGEEPTEAEVRGARGDRKMNTSTLKLQIARINRKLAKRYEKLRTSRSHGELQNLGDHYLVDTYSNTVIDSNVDLDVLEAKLCL
jgi:hypothetical protein